MKFFYKLKFWNDKIFYATCKVVNIILHISLVCSLLLVIGNHVFHLPNKEATNNLGRILIMCFMIDIGKTLQKNKKAEVK